MSGEFKNLIASLRNSSFSRANYQVDTDMSDLLSSLLMFLDRPSQRLFDNKEISVAKAVEIIFSRVPVFQRNNDKWTQEMQASYAHNLLKGFRGAPLCFYTIGNHGKTNCFILDGLQRLTAMLRFMITQDLDIPLPDGSVIVAKDFLASEEGIIHVRGMYLPIRIYEFANEIEAVEFYIEMNENISHSSEDIQRAKDYLAKLKSM
jgi:hypothetical protein